MISISVSAVEPMIFNSTPPTLEALLEIKLLPLQNLRFEGEISLPAFVREGDIWKPSLFWGWPTISIW